MEKIEAEATIIKELRESVLYIPRPVQLKSTFKFCHAFNKSAMSSVRKMFGSITHAIDVVIRNDIVPSDTKITVKSDSIRTIEKDLVVVHTFPITPFVTIQIL